MTRRTVSQIAVFILLCVPLLSLVSFLVYSVIPNAQFVILHPVACALFLLLGLYAASVLHGWQTAKRYWYWITVLGFGIIGTWCAVAYLLGMTPPFLLLHVAIAPGAIAVFLAIVLYLMFLPTQRKFRVWFGVGVVVCIAYLLGAPYITLLTGIDVWQPFLPIWSALLCVCSVVAIWASEDSDTKNDFSHIARIMWTILIIGIVGTTIFVRTHTLRVQQKHARVFAQETAMVENQVEAVVDAYNTLARTLTRQVELSDALTLEQWADIVARVDARTYPAITAISYVPRVLEGEKEMFPVVYATSFTESLQVAPGFDISTDEVRNRTLRSAIEGNLVMTTPIMPDTGMFSLYAPLSKTVGIVAITIDKEKLVRHISSQQNPDVLISVLETGTPQPRDGLVLTRSVVLGQTPWTIVFSSARQPSSTPYNGLLMFGYISTIALALIVAVLHILFHRRRHGKTKGVFVIQPIKTTILPVLQALIDEYEGIFAQKKIDFAVTIPKRLPAVIADTVVLHVVLGTILRNMYETTSVRGTLTFDVKTVSIKRVPQSIVISCTDTTTVLSTKTERALFEKASTVELVEGTVLESLYRSKRMLSAIGAGLTVSSEEGVGTTAVVTIVCPVTEAPKVL